MHAMQSTTLTCCLGDPVLTNSLAEFLLQVQSGLPQGSMKSGLSSPKGSVIMSTNSAECARIYGRIIRLDYVKDSQFNKQDESTLQQGLKDLVTSNKGFLVAWTMLFLPRWLNCNGRKDALVDILRDTLIKLVPDQQPRWHKGTANLVYTYIVLHQIAGENPDTMQALRVLASSGRTMQQQHCPFWKAS
ncbi:unnamed protein product [Porites lobata]|uniref:Uncharacterized protein n=1 Tax=Porites lobata TaxID=104759 RepID=A0ABN8Q9K7_9CNID|nr:unnamed protein product [Porites lobata]